MPEYHRRINQGLICLALILFSGCSPARGIDAPVRFTVVSDLIAAPLAEKLVNAFEEAHPDLYVAFEALPVTVMADRLESGEAELAITFSDPPPEHFTSAIGVSEWRVSVNLDMGLEVMVLDDFRALMSGEQAAMGEEACEAVIFTFPDGFAAEEVTSSLLALESPITSNAILVFSAQDILRRLQDEPCGLAFLPDYFGDYEIRQIPLLVRIGAITRDQLFRRELLFVASETPTGPEGDFLDFLLSPEGQSILEYAHEEIR